MVYNYSALPRRIHEVRKLTLAVDGWAVTFGTATDSKTDKC